MMMLLLSLPHESNDDGPADAGLHFHAFAHRWARGGGIPSPDVHFLFSNVRTPPPTPGTANPKPTYAFVVITTTF